MRLRGPIFALALFGLLACRPEAPIQSTEPSERVEPTAREPATEPAIWLDLPPGERVVTPTELCDHVTTITSAAAQLGGQDAGLFRSQCIDEANLDLARLGAEPFQAQATCMMAAKTIAELDACDGSINVSIDAEARMLCEHVIAILFAEMGPLMGTELDPQLLEECAAGLARERATMEPEAFARQRECVMRANAMAELEGCDKPPPPPP